jgi:hypothetical protein
LGRNDFRSWLKARLEKKLDLQFKLMEDRARALVEVEKDVEKARRLKYLDKEITIYPEIIEVVYRLKNLLSQVVSIFASELWQRDAGISRKGLGDVATFRDGLFVFTENLYKYRAFLDDSIWKDIHQFKRRLQDAALVLEQLTRPEERKRDVEPDNHSRATSMKLLIGELEARFRDSDELYEKITRAIRNSLQGGMGKGDRANFGG